MYKTEQEKQDDFLNAVGRQIADKIDRLWKNTYPRYCSINDEYPEHHTKEDVFREQARNDKIPTNYIDLFLDL